MNQFISLPSIIPDPDVLLGLEPEELAKILLIQVIPSHTQNGIFCLQSISEPSNSMDRYPGNKQKEMGIALGEAWNWLHINSFIVPDPGINGTNGFMVLTRRGRKIANEQDFEHFREAAAFPKSLLHPTIADKVWLELARGDFDSAVFKAFKAVEIAVRSAGGLEDTLIGIDLMRKAFGKGGPLTDGRQVPAEQEALAHLFAGAIGSYKNPHSHRDVTIDSRDAQEMVLLASHLLRIVDARSTS